MIMIDKPPGKPSQKYPNSQNCKKLVLNKSRKCKLNYVHFCHCFPQHKDTY